MSIAEIELPDGSKVSLNANTKLSYIKDKSSNKRLVTLEGEALFDVIHDENSPFVLNFDQLKIIDLGTKFSVKAYKETEIIETSLFEGALDLIVDNKSLTHVVPGESYVIDTESKQVQKVERLVTNPLAWKNNRFEYHNANLETILNDLSRWYDFRIEWQNEVQKSKQFLLKVNKTQQVEPILELLALGSDMQYEIEMKDRKINKVIVK
jgi:ferric-dicitrate binding protein FerR (iron transport regulator)